ncbi:MAG: PAS domain S-box protein, partial [Verrucomicrobiota bacterium]
MESNTSKIPTFLYPPVLKDQEQARVARIVHIFCLMVSLGLVLAAINPAMSRQWTVINIMVGGEVGILLAFRLCHAGMMAWSTRWLVLTLLILATSLVCLAGQGIHDAAILVYPSALVLAGQILTRRSFIACVVVMILSVAGVVTAEMQGMLVNQWSLLTRWSDLVDISIILLITSIAVEILAESLRKSLFRSHRSEANYDEIFNATSEVIIFHDAETGDILDVNNATLKMFGYSREEILSQKINELSLGKCPYSAEETMGWIHHPAETGPKILVWHCQRKNGTWFWGEVTLKSTNIGGEGRIMIVMRDISERKLIEEKLYESQQMLRSVMDTIP